MTNIDTVELATRITKNLRIYEKVAANYWRSFDVTKAVRYRGMAEGYEGALNLLAEICQETSGGGPAVEGTES